MNKQKGFAHFVVIGLLLVTTGGMVLAAVNVYNNVTKDQKDTVMEASEGDSDTAREQYLDGQSEAESNSEGTASESSEDTSSQVIGNSDPTKKPELPASVPEPTTAIAGLQAFFDAVKAADFVTANALLGAPLASALAEVAGTSEASLALSACQNDSVCSVLLNSFNPPSSGYSTKSYTPSQGSAGEQISFLLSQSSPTVSALISKDANIDVFMEDYQGVWVVQNIYIDGSPITDFSL